MSRNTGFFLVDILVGAFLISSATALGAESSLTVGGSVKLFSSAFTQDDKRDPLWPHEAGDYSLNRGEMELKVFGYASDNVSFNTKLRYLSLIHPQFDSLSDLESSTGFESQVYEDDFIVRESSFTVNDFLTEGMDLTVGRQRVRWGTSDEYNVIDNLNPVDFANLFTFDPDYFVDHVPMDGFDLEYRFPSDFDLKLQAVYFLSFKPSPLPAGFETFLLLEEQEILDQVTTPLGLPTGLALVRVSDIPEHSIDEGPRGVRLSGNFLNFDVGMSYYSGHQTLPLPEALVTTLSFTGTSSLEAFFEYPRLDVFGFDLAGELRSVGLWAEVGIYVPEKSDVSLITITPLGTIQDEVRLLEDTYTKVTVGFDYTFGIGDGLYWNTQYNRGFYDEVAYTSRANRALGVDTAGFMGRLEDYYISSLEYSFHEDEVTLKEGVLLEVADYQHFSREHAWGLNPEIEYKPFDNLSFLVGYTLIEGERLSKFGLYDKSDIAYLLCKIFF